MDAAPAAILSVSTDQVAAFAELARLGSLRAAAAALHLTEQGLRSRLLVLEERLGLELYRKQRGPRRVGPLTETGRRFLPQALSFLEHARQLAEAAGAQKARREIHVAASQYLIIYVLIDAVRRFHSAYPGFRVRLSNRTERDVEKSLLEDPEISLGVAAPYEASSELQYVHLFSMDWSLIAPLGHPLLKKHPLSLKHLEDQPLILFERGSTGRQHVMDAFHGAALSPRVDMETTNTEIMVRMVEAGLGVSIVPLLPSGVVTRGHRVGVSPLGHQIRPIHSGILIRRGESLSPASRAFVDFLMPEGRKKP